MVSAREIQDRFEAAKSLQQLERLEALYRVRDEIGKIERAALSDPGFSLVEIREAKALLAEVQSAIGTAEKAMKRNGWTKKKEPIRYFKD